MLSAIGISSINVKDGLEVKIVLSILESSLKENKDTKNEDNNKINTFVSLLIYTLIVITQLFKHNLSYRLIVLKLLEISLILLKLRNKSFQDVLNFICISLCKIFQAIVIYILFLK